MRSICTWLAATVLTGSLMVLAPGCGGGTTDLEKPPVVTKPPDPMTDMPGFKESQENLKKAGKIK